MSGMPMRKIGTSTWASLQASMTAAPKPPARQPSSMVTTRPMRRARGRIRSVSKGRTKRALTTVARTPFSCSSPAVAIAGATIEP